MRHRAVLIVTLLFAALASAVAVPARPSAAVSCFPCPATTTDWLNLRAEPSLSAAILDVMPPGAEIEWDPTVAPQNGFTYVTYGATEGWAFTDYLILYPAAATTTDWLNLREGPGLSYAVITVIPPGETVQLLGGPTNGLYDVGMRNGLSGYAHGDYLDFARRQSFMPGDEVIVVTDALNVRTGPSLSHHVISLVYQGDYLVVQEGPVVADNYSWYKVTFDSEGDEGWVAGDYLSAA